MDILNRREIIERLRVIQLRRKFGDDEVAIDRVARQAGIDPTTIRALLRGENSMSIRTQIRLSRALQEISESGKSRLGHVSFGPNGAQIGFGVGRGRILR